MLNEQRHIVISYIRDNYPKCFMLLSETQYPSIYDQTSIDYSWYTFDISFLLNMYNLPINNNTYDLLIDRIRNDKLFEERVMMNKR